ncbi:MAG: hypothetical protein ACR2HN_04045 [Tepidiformaceae bacterium]
MKKSIAIPVVAATVAGTAAFVAGRRMRTQHTGNGTRGTRDWKLPVADTAELTGTPDRGEILPWETMDRETRMREPNPHPASKPIAVGGSVVTRDGAELGVIRAMRDGCFQVDAVGKGDYWLNCAHLLPSSDAAQAVVDFDGNQVGDYQLAAPGPQMAASPMLDAESDVFAGAADQRRTREAMQRGHA